MKVANITTYDLLYGCNNANLCNGETKDKVGFASISVVSEFADISAVNRFVWICSQSSIISTSHFLCYALFYVFRIFFAFLNVFASFCAICIFFALQVKFIVFVQNCFKTKWFNLNAKQITAKLNVKYCFKKRNLYFIKTKKSNNEIPHVSSEYGLIF